MDPVALFIGEALGTAVSRFRAYLRRRRGDDIPQALRDSAAVPIKGAVEGGVHRIVGRLRLVGGEPLVAPLTQRSCAYYELSLEELEEDRRSAGWALRHYDWAAQDFVIEDEAGSSALVRAQDLSVALDIDVKSKPKLFRELPAPLAQLLDDVAVQHGVMVRDRRRVCAYEGVLEAGELINVYGMCRWQADAESASYRDSASRLVITPPPGQRLIVTDMLR